MSLMRFHYDPFADFDRLFDSALASRLRPAVPVDGARRTDSFHPRMDIQESKDTNTVTATFELPGMTSDDVHVNVHQNRLTVSGETRKSHSHEEEGGYVVHERSHGTFSRTLQLPPSVNADDIKCKLENGVLTVTFPMTASQQEAQRISIQ